MCDPSDKVMPLPDTTRKGNSNIVPASGSGAATGATNASRNKRCARTVNQILQDSYRLYAHHCPPNGRGKTVDRAYTHN